jgi:hypothetical protein
VTAQNWSGLTRRRPQQSSVMNVVEASADKPIATLVGTRRALCPWPAETRA